MNQRQLLLLLFFFSALGVAYANPLAPDVVQGQVTFAHPDPNTLAITNSPGAIINWQSFGIDVGEITQFIQQGPNSAVLNRVIGQDPSAIMGQLNSNGQVYLVNPNGIVVGQNAVIDTAGFVASTLSISDEDFKRGELNFADDGAAGNIVNRGFIKVGQDGNVLLVAPSITNEGMIQTDGGNLILAAGHAVTITSLDDPALQFDIQAPDNEVVNLGELVVNHGAAEIFAGSIAQQGSIQANSLTVDDQGRVQLIATDLIDITSGSQITANGARGGEILIDSARDTIVKGALEATGEDQGGDIRVLGARVGLFAEATVGASGRHGGGQVLIGGDYQGANNAVKNARQTEVGDRVTIRANAEQSGDGGKVIVWADGYTGFSGRAEAVAGNNDGDGGFVEISGKETLAFTGEVDASAANGEAGTVLFDPKNIDINDAGGAAVLSNDEFTEDPTGDVQMDPADIVGILESGTDVTLQANNDITLTSDLISTGPAFGRTLTFQAGRTIDISATLQFNAGSIDLRANDDSAQILNRDPGAGSIFIRNGQSVVTGSGNETIDLSLGTAGTIGSITLEEGASISTIEAPISLVTAAGGSIVLAPAGLSAAASISTLGEDLTMIADTIDLQGVGTQIFTSSGLGFIATVKLAPASGSVAIVNTASGASGATLELEVADLQNIDLNGLGDGFLVIGDTSNATDITIVDNFAPAGGGNIKDRVSFEGSGNFIINANLDGTGLTGVDSGHSFETNIGGNIIFNATVDTGSANGAFLFGQNNTGASASFAAGSLNSPLFSITGGSGVDALLGNATLNDAYIINGANAGNLSNSNISTVNFSNIENLNANGGDDVFVFQSGGSLSGFIDGGAGSDTADYSALATSINASLPAVGGTDGFDIAEASVAGNMTNMNGIIGGSNTDSLAGANVANVWNITGNNLGTVNGFGFSSFENLTGGSSSDTFVFADGATVNQFNGNSTPALNTADFSAWTTDLTFTQTASDTFDVAGMTTNPNIGNVTGGAGNDTFIMSGNVLAIFNGTLDGSAGFDTLDYDANARAENATIDLENGTATDIAGIINFEDYVGSTAATTNQLIGSNAGATWVLTNDTDGTFGSNTFSNFQDVQGGTGVDNFTLPDGFDGAIQDLGGDNTYLFTGAFGASATITSGSGNDTFNFSGAGGAIDGVIDTAAGADILQFNGGVYDLNTNPTSVSDIVINAGGTANINVNQAIGGLIINDTGVLGGTGNVAVSSGLTISSSAVSNIINNSGTLFLDNTAISTITLGVGGDLSVTGGGVFQNDGILTINGAVAGSQINFDNTVTVDNNALITIDVGQMNVNSAFTNDADITLTNGGTFGGLGASFTNGPSGELTGNGTFVATNGLSNNGIIAPGLSIGTLNITGDLTFNSGSVYLAEVTSGLSADQLIVSGNVNIDTGAVLTIQAFGGYGGNGGDTFTNVLQAGGAIAGTSGVFDTVNQPGGFSVNPTYNVSSMDLGVASALFNTWIGGLVGDWDVISNWSFGALPLAGDDVLIDTLGATVTIDALANNANSLTILSGILLDVMAGSLTVQSASNIDGDLSVSGGSLSLLGASTVDGSFSWTAGTVSAPNTLTLNGVTNISGGTLDLNSGIIEHTNISGSSSFTPTQFNLNGSTFRNTGTLAIGDVFVDQDSIGAGLFENTGTLNKSTPGTFDISNAGTHTFTSTGTINILSGDVNVNRDSILSGALTGPGVLVWANGSSEGTLNIGAGSTLQIISGTHTLSGAITYNGLGRVLWDAGTIALSGFDMIVNTELDITGTDVALNGGGALIHNNTSGNSVLDVAQINLNGSTFRNTAAAILQIDTPLAGDEVLYDQDSIAAGVFENLGTINKTGSGEFDVSNLGTLSFTNTGTLNVTGGQVFINNTSSLDGNLTGGGKLLWNNGTSQGTIDVGFGSTFEIGSGTHTLAAPMTFNGLGDLIWNGGTIALSGNDMTVNTPLMISGGNVILNGGGALIHTDGSGASVLSATQLDVNGATFRNTASGVLEINAPLVTDTVLYDQDSIAAGLFENLGTINKTGLGAFEVFNGATITFDNSGTMNIAGGQIFVNNTSVLNGNLTGAGKLVWNNGSSSGNLNIGAGSTLEISGGTHTLSAASNYSGLGTVIWSDGTLAGSDLTIDTIFQVTGTGENTLNSVTLTHTNTSGSSVFDSTGTWNINGATFLNTGTFNVDSGAGTIFIDQDSIGPGVFDNQGTLNKLGSGRFEVFSGATLSFENSGTIDMQAGEIFINNTSVLNGNLTGSGGPLIWNNGTSSGNLNIGAGSILEISGGTHSFGATSSYSGLGTVQWLSGIIQGADLTVNTALEITGSAENSLNSVTLTHTNTSGASIFDSTGTFNINGGTFLNTGTLDIDATATTVFIDQDTIGVGTFRNTGTLNKTGAGRFEVFSGATLTFDNDGTLNINAGEVFVDQPFTNDGLIDIAAAATLTGDNTTFVNGASGTIQGIGTIGTTASGLSNQGLISPGNGNVGTLNVSGNLNFDSGGTFDVQLAPGLTSDRVIVSGNVNINAGSILNVTTTGGYAGNFGDAFAGVLTTSGTVNGAFSTINQPGFSVTPSYIIGPAGDMTLTVGGIFNTWTGAIDSDWLTPGNWSLGVVPDSTMDVRINTVGQNITVGGTGTQMINTLGVVSGSSLQFLGSNLQLNANSTINGDLLIGTTLSGAGDIISNGIFSLSIGNLSGSGDIFINNLFSINNTAGAANIGQTVNINSGGLAVWQAAAQNINNAGGGNFQVLNGGTFDIQNNATTDVDFAIASGGTFTKTAGVGSSFFTGNVVNDGTIDAQAGTLSVTGAFTDNGNINVGNTATFAVPAGFNQNGGVTNLNAGGTLDVGANAITLLAGGMLTGNGGINGDLNNVAGIVSPGASPGALIITGNYAQGPGGTLLIEIQNPGVSPGVDYDHITVAGTAALDGILQVGLLGGFVPTQGQSFDILNYSSASGAFASIPDVDLMPGALAFSGLDQGLSFQLSAGDVVLPAEPIGPITPVDPVVPELPAEDIGETDLSEVIALDENDEFFELLPEEEDDSEDEEEYKVCSG